MMLSYCRTSISTSATAGFRTKRLVTQSAPESFTCGVTHSPARQTRTLLDHCHAQCPSCVDTDERRDHAAKKGPLPRKRSRKARPSKGRLAEQLKTGAQLCLLCHPYGADPPRYESALGNAAKAKGDARMRRKGPRKRSSRFPRRRARDMRVSHKATRGESVSPLIKGSRTHSDLH